MLFLKASALFPLPTHRFLKCPKAARLEVKGEAGHGIPLLVANIDGGLLNSHSLLFDFVQTSGLD